MTVQDLLAFIDLKQLPMDAPILLVSESGAMGPAAILQKDDLNRWDDLNDEWPNEPCLVLEREAP